MSNDRISVDREFIQELKDYFKNNLDKNKDDVPLEPYIQDLIPWLQNIDKRRITICNGCGLAFIANKVGQKSCSNVCRNAAWKKKKKAEKLKEGSESYDEYVSHFIDWEDPNLKGRDD